MNELDRAVLALQRSQAAAPQLYRQLTTGELCFLLPFHPEMAEGGHMSVHNGSQFPFCVQTELDGREVVPIFSSEARLEESLQAGKTPPNKFLCGTMKAVQVLEIIGKCGFPAVLNRGCATGELTLPPNLLCDLADGSIFRLPEAQDPKPSAVIPLDPADYPTDLIQPAFEFIRQHHAFRAAWVFLTPDEAANAPSQKRYQLIFLMTPPDLVLFHDLTLAVNCFQKNGYSFDLGVVDESNQIQIRHLLTKSPPFYRAPDFDEPRGD